MGFTKCHIYYRVIIIFSYEYICIIYNLCEDISNDVSVYLSNCGSIVETAWDSVCYGSI